MILIPKLKISQRIYPPKIESIENEITNQPTLEESSMTNSSIASSDGGVESAKEKDERTILDEPMVAKALELFAPKKVRVKRKN